MKKGRNNSSRASTLQIALSTGLISISAVLLALAAPTITKKAPRHDPHGFQLKEGSDTSTTLGNYPDTSVPLSSDTTVTPDAAPTNTTSISVWTNSNFNGTFAASPTTGVVTVTDAHPAGTYTVAVTAFNGGGPTATKTFALTVTTPATCPEVNFAGPENLGIGMYPRFVAVGDFNGDGKQDIAVVNDGSNNVSILLGDGAGHFSAATNFPTGGSASIAVGDFNGDGKQDLATAGFGSGGLSILFGDGAGHFSAATNLGAGDLPISVAVGDFNGDGKQDLAVANEASNNVSILLGDGAGHFSAPTNFPVGSLPESVVVGDFNADGKQDLAVANSDSANVSILLGDGTGHFSAATNFGTGSGPLSVALGDFNGDGKQDLAVANYSAKVSILLGDGAGHFSAPTNFDAGDGPSSVAVGDFNGDGNQDLAVANYGSPNLSILLGDGSGHFSGPINFLAGDGPQSVAVGDFNGDSVQDLAAANYFSNNVSILLRDCIPRPTPATTHFLVNADPYVFQGFEFYLQVRAKDQFNTTVTGYPGRAHFTSSGQAYSLPPDSLLPNGVGTFMATLITLGYQTITATDTSDPSITGTSNPILVESEQPPSTATPTSTVFPTPTATITPAPTPTASASPTPSPSPTPAAQAVNLSTRMLVQTGDNVGIGGFIITGSAPKQVLLRGVGASLANSVPNPLADPILELHGPPGFGTIVNDNWMDPLCPPCPPLCPPCAPQAIPPELAPPDPLESIILFLLPPGAYTVILRGHENAPTGVGLVEVYDLSEQADSRLANISTRAFVSTGGDILIAGFILGNGTMPDNVIVRGIGPSLAGLGVPNALADPTLELRDSNGALLATNNDWQDDPAQAALIAAAGLAPTNPLESGIAATLAPGLYTALLAGLNNGTGVGLVEVYDSATP